jgi:hypothetical protein
LVFFIGISLTRKSGSRPRPREKRFAGATAQQQSQICGRQPFSRPYGAGVETSDAGAAEKEQCHHGDRLSRYSIGSRPRPGLTLGYAGFSVEQLSRAVIDLAAQLKLLKVRRR